MPTHNTITQVLTVDEATCLDAFVAGGKAPTEIRLFKKGANPSVKGTFWWDDIAASAVMKKYREMGRPITWDYDHAALRQNSERPDQTAKSAGICELELRDGDLWAVRIRWVKAAKEAIEAGEWPFFSPAFATVEDDKKRKRPIWLINVALTGNPALHDIQEITEGASALWLSLFGDADPADALSASPAPASDQDHAEANRLEAARKTAAAWATQNLGVYGPVGQPPSDHEAAKAPLTVVYPNPNAAGWLGAVLPKSGDGWVAFVRPDGRTALWSSRNDDGSVAGPPTLFQRDLDTLHPEAAGSAAQPSGNETTAKRSDQQTSNPASPSGQHLAALAASAGDTDVDAELAALRASNDAFAAAVKALDWNPDQERDPDGKFGSGGGAATEPAIRVGGQGTSPGHGKSGGSGAVSGVRTKSDHAENVEKARGMMRDESRRATERADKIGSAANKSGSAASHEKAEQAHRIASTMHRTTAKHDPDNAASHNAAADRHEKAAAEHGKAAQQGATATSAVSLAVGQRRAVGQFSFGRELAVGDCGLSGRVSRRADLASHSAHTARTADAHTSAAEVNREAAAEHESLRDKHLALADSFPQHASLHKAEAKAHASAAKRHLARAEMHATRAASLASPAAETAALAVDAAPGAALTEDAAKAAQDAAAARTERALKSAAAWATGAAVGAPGYGYADDLAASTDWLAICSPLSGTYPDPSKNGGWVGWIEDTSKGPSPWIAFVAVNGLMLLWQQRDANGDVLGNPVQLWRDPSSLPTPLPQHDAGGQAPQAATTEQPKAPTPAAALSTTSEEPSAGVAEPHTTEKLTMHKSLNDYAEKKGLSLKALKTRLGAALKDTQGLAAKCDAALGDDESKHPSDAEMKAMMKALAAFDEADEDDDEGDSDKLKAKLAALKAEKASLKARLAALDASPIEKAAKGDKLSVAALSALGVGVGLSADAEPDVVVRAALANVETTRELCSALGVKNADAILGKVEALQASAEEGKAAVAKLASYEAEQVKNAAALSIATAEKENRLTPAKKAKAESFLANGKYEALSAFLDACEPIAAMAQTQTQTQLDAKQHEALAKAGVHPTGNQGAPTAKPGDAGTATTLSVDSIMKDPEFLATAKGCGISENVRELRAFAEQVLADKQGVTVTQVIDKLSVTA